VPELITLCAGPIFLQPWSGGKRTVFYRFKTTCRWQRRCEEKQSAQRATFNRHR
jgi:hypothetical protein